VLVAEDLPSPSPRRLLPLLAGVRVFVIGIFAKPRAIGDPLSSGDSSHRDCCRCCFIFPTFRFRDCFCLRRRPTSCRRRGLESGDGPEAGALGARRAHCCNLSLLLRSFFSSKKNRFQKQQRIRGPKQVPGEASVQFRFRWAWAYGVQRISFRHQKGLGVLRHMSGELFKLLPSNLRLGLVSTKFRILQRERMSTIA